MNLKIVRSGLLVLALCFSFSVNAHEAVTEKPFTDQEVLKFMDDYASLSLWAKEQRGIKGQVNHPWIMAGMQFNKEFSDQLASKGWEKERFFYILNHLNQGLMTFRQERDQARTKAQMQRFMIRGSLANEATMAQANKAAEQFKLQRESWLREQFQKQAEALRTHPTMPPQQKQEALALLKRQETQALRPVVAATDAESSAKQMERQQKAWQATQRQNVLSNPFIPPDQKRIILAQMEQSWKGMQTQAAPVPQDPAALQEEAIQQKKRWIEHQQQQINANPFIPPQDRQRMNAQWKKSLERMEAELNQVQTADMISKEEKAVVEKYGFRLMDLFYNAQ